MDASALQRISTAIRTMDEAEQAGFESFVANREKGKEKLVELVRFLSTNGTDPLVAREIEACKRLIERIDGRFVKPQPKCMEDIFPDIWDCYKDGPEQTGGTE